ncbi:MAG: dihydroorotate dehydrogenase electron transfer subunit [Lachnospiraceae bacterium]|nr:dihydroorotate dehydrogenase electron transfer subunit [Lachnospiraceae bacterium]
MIQLEEIMTILSNEKIAADVYKMELSGNTELVSMPGQFVNIKVPGFYLRRPISICDYEPGKLTIIYKLVGNGTDAMSKMQAGDELNMLMGLGNGFNTELSGEYPLLVGGGVGTPPIYGLAKRLVAQGKKVSVVLGFASKQDVFYQEKFSELNENTTGGSCKVYVATVDGSFGTKGFVTNCLDEIEEISHYYACGPIPMLKALIAKLDERQKDIPGQLSFEERMGCGFGACVGCSIDTKSGYKKVCKDGPVFMSSDIVI